MYSVYLDKQLIHDLDSEDNVLVDPTLNLELNKAGTFEFSMECTHPFYDKLERFKSIIQVLQDGEEIFKGRIIEVSDDMYKKRSVYCESELAYLNDTIQRPCEFHLAANAVVEYLNAIIGSHNEQVDESRQFELGDITIRDPNDYIYCYTNYNSTMEELKEDLVDDLGGYIRVRNVYANNDPLGTLQHRYLDYIGLEEYGKTSEQYIEFGENLLDFVSNIDQSDLCTGIIPLGATLEESEYSAIEERVTIESVNGGSDYIVIPEAVEKYGLILKVVTWDDISEPGNLLTTGENYLSEYDYENMVITATAVDLSILPSTESSTETLTLREVLEAYDTVVYTLTAKNTITEIISYEVYDRDDTGYAKITQISFSGKTVSVTVDNSSKTDDLDITINVVVATMGGIESWRLGDMIFAESTPHDVHKRFPLAQMTIPLDQPDNTSVTLGTYTDSSLSAKTNKTEAGLRNFENFSTGNIIASAVAQATKLIDTKTNGYVTLHYDEDRGCVDELLIMDTPDTSTAKRVWRWNLNGLGYSSTGYSGDEAAYGTAITMDGTILGKFIIANGMILADDNEETFGHFDSEGMKIYKQAGKSDNLSLAITKSGMTVYESTRTAEFTSGSVVFNYNGKQQGRLYAPGATAGLILELNDPDDGTPMLQIGDPEETAMRVVRVVNKLQSLDFEVLESGQRGLWDPVYSRWLIGYNADGDTYLDAASSVTIGKPLVVNGDITSNGNNVLTTATSKSIKFQNDNGNTTVSIPFTTATTTVDIQALFDKYALTSAIPTKVGDLTNDVGYATTGDLSSLESSIAGTYATKAEIPSNVGAFTNDAGYVTSNDTATIKVTEGSYTSNFDFSFSSGATLNIAGPMSNYATRYKVNVAITDGTTTVSGTSASAFGGTVSVDIRDLVGGGFEDATLNIMNSDFSSTRYCTGTITSGGTTTIDIKNLISAAVVSGARALCDSSGYEYVYMSAGGATLHIGYYLSGFQTITMETPGDIRIGLGAGESTAAETVYIGREDTSVIIKGYSYNVSGSDERLKTSIQPLNTSGLDNLTPVSFKWRDGDDKTHYGYIAQEVQPYFPELVSEGTDGMLGLAYTELIPLLHAEIKTLKEEIAQLKKAIGKLTTEEEKKK